MRKEVFAETLATDPWLRLPSWGHCRILKRCDRPTLLFLRHDYSDHRVLAQIFCGTNSLAAHVNNGDVGSHKSNLFDRQTDGRVFENGIKYLLMRAFDYGSALEVPPINDHISPRLLQTVWQKALHCYHRANPANGSWRIVQVLSTAFLPTTLRIPPTVFFVHLTIFYPITSDLSAWYAADFVMGLITCLALVVFAFYTSLAGQPLFRSSLFSDNA